MLKIAHSAAVALLVSGCAPKSQEPEYPSRDNQQRYEDERDDSDVSYDFDAPPEPTKGQASPDDRWWEAESPCPPESSLYGGPPPDHDRVGCKTESGKNVGRFTRFHPSGTKREEGQYENHFAEGIFTAWDEQGQK